MNQKVEAKKQGGRVIVGRPATEKRLEELANKKSTKTQAEVNEEILLRLARIEQALGIH